MASLALVACTRPEKSSDDKGTSGKRKRARPGMSSGATPTVKKSRHVHIEIFRFLDKIVKTSGDHCGKIGAGIRNFIKENGQRIKKRTLEIAKEEANLPRVKKMVRKAYFQAQTRHILEAVKPTLRKCNQNPDFKRLSNELIWLTLVDRPKK